mgnify:CR=1 FL=1
MELARVVLFLERTRKMGLVMSMAKADCDPARTGVPNLELRVYSDANLAEPSSQRGNFICLESANSLIPLTWRSKRQPLAVDSPGASELIAAQFALKEHLMFYSGVRVALKMGVHPLLL